MELWVDPGKGWRQFPALMPDPNPQLALHRLLGLVPVILLVQLLSSPIGAAVS